MSTFNFILLSILIINFGLIISIVFIERKKPESAISWILAILFMPFVGFFLYLIFGDTFRFNLKRRDKNKQLSDKIYKNEFLKRYNNQNLLKIKNNHQTLATLNYNNCGAFITSNNDITLFTETEKKYKSLFKDIKEAKSSVHLSYFIIRNDQIGKQLIDLLKNKVKEGVEVRLLYDKLGSRRVAKKLFAPLIKEGGQVIDFFPTKLWLRPHHNHRNHRKMVIVDGKFAYVGGANIGEEYLSRNEKIRPWRDSHIKIEGASVNIIQTQFFLDFLFVAKEHINFDNKQIISKYFPPYKKTDNKKVQIIASGPDYRQANIRDSYLKIISSAKKEIIIQTPYFIPDESLLDALLISAKSGVKVKLMIPGVPDKKTVHYATLSFIEELLEAGVEVYFYRGFIHSKVIMCDESIVSIGSANFDIRSFNINFEINAIVYNKSFYLENLRAFENDVLNSKKITYKDYLNRNSLQKTFEQVFRLFSPIL